MTSPVSEAPDVRGVPHAKGDAEARNGRASVRLHQLYGMTEAAPLVTQSTPEDHRRGFGVRSRTQPASTQRGRKSSACRCRSVILRPASLFPTASPARSGFGDPTSCSAIGAVSRRRGQPSPQTAGTARVTWRSPTTTDTSTSSIGQGHDHQWRRERVLHRGRATRSTATRRARGGRVRSPGPTMGRARARGCRPLGRPRGRRRRTHPPLPQRIAGYKVPRSGRNPTSRCRSRAPARSSSASCATRIGRAENARFTDGVAEGRPASADRPCRDHGADVFQRV